ncbi:RNA polymerase sigma factor [Allosphingosinicella deserti]|uniref:RNA polymerase subunit sigma-24 n=1 Tax=Allosphingosinicella deserti TaxID=2116704 RepID=A0A2P7QW17_9SPHN|nr:sigma-70 family RNA polymerase sigma factor [Sphingomonas deserti]PSJ42168.1 RNA polymerase subunit sigma-24 [Sphingomonas deserti]
MRLIPDVLRALTSPGLTDGDPLPSGSRARHAPLPALGDLYHREAPRLLRYFARRADRQDVNDLVQESFTLLARAAAGPDQSIERPEAYLNRIAANLLRSRAKSALQRSLARHVPAEDALLVAPDAVTALEARDTLNRLQAALMRLSPKTRAIFLAHRLEGLSYNEIATTMALSVKGVEWHMSKALTHLNRALGSR